MEEKRKFRLHAMKASFAYATRMTPLPPPPGDSLHVLPSGEVKSLSYHLSFRDLTVSHTGDRDIVEVTG